MASSNVPAEHIVVQKNPTLGTAISDAQLVLAYAARAGVALGIDVVKTVVDIGSLAVTEQISPEQEVQFWSMWTKLSEAVSPLTIASLRAITLIQPAQRLVGASTQARLAELRYRVYAMLALSFLLVAQVYWLFGTSITVEIAKTHQEFIEVSAKRRAADQAAQQAVGAVGSQAGADAPANQEIYALQAQESTLKMRETADFSLLVTWFRPWSWLVMNQTPNGGQQAVSLNAARLQTALTILDIFQRYVLSLLYGFLGACVFVLRGLSAEIRNWTYCRDSDIRFRIRLYLGTLGGMVIAWFVTPESNPTLFKSLSPFALAFVAGYSVELLFAAMDKIVSAFTNVATSAGGANPAK